MIVAHHLAKHFGPVIAVEDVTLEVSEGEILALLGPNGAGKTTTVRMLCSLIKPTSGWASISGYDTVSQARDVRNSVGLLTELPGLYGRMNPMEYLDFFGRLQSVDTEERARRGEDLLRYFGLWEHRHRSVSTFSKGMRQKVALARALLHSPRVILLDEPTSAMDPASAKSVRDYVKGLRDKKHTFIICTHNLAEAEDLADRIAIIKGGRIVAHGTLEDLKRQLLGPVQFQVRFSQQVDPALFYLDGLIRVQEWGPDWVRYHTPEPQEANPTFLRHLVTSGAQVLSLSEVPSRLEDVYLKLAQE